MGNTGLFDLVAFGYLDSQALFSYGSSLRLDGYTYTVEGFEKAFERVAPNGLLAVSFVAGPDWMVQKLTKMVETATGKPPLVYWRDSKITIVAPKKEIPASAIEIEGWKRLPASSLKVDLATDDWPYLYLNHRGLPSDYGIVIGLLLVVSLLTLLGFRGAAFDANDGHFLFMGWGFLLLQTKSIGDCSLYFGTTWLVTTIVIAGVLLMILLANWTALHFVRKFHPWLYAPLFLSLIVLLAVPRESILAQALAVRVVWTLVAVPLPVFFAGLIFSTTFRETNFPALALGANLIGATIGGFCEYLGMWVGSRTLSYVVIAAYAASFACLVLGRLRWTRAGGAG